jgi:hypothetical protein
MEVFRPAWHLASPQGTSDLHANRQHQSPGRSIEQVVGMRAEVFSNEPVWVWFLASLRCCKTDLVTSAILFQQQNAQPYCVRRSL